MPNEPYSTSEEIKAWDIAPGVGVGKKWVNKKGWTFEYMLGFGRYLFASKKMMTNLADEVVKLQA